MRDRCIGRLKREPNNMSRCTVNNMGHKRLQKRKDEGKHDKLILLEPGVVSWVKGFIVELKFRGREGVINKWV